MSVKVGWCLIHLSSTPKAMRNRLAKPYYTRSWSKDGSSRPMRSKARRAWCATVHGSQGYAVIPIKDNNPAVHGDLQEFFEDEGIDRHEFFFLIIRRPPRSTLFPCPTARIGFRSA